MASKPYRKPFSYFDLVENFPRPGCAVCRMLLRDTDQIVDGLLYGFMGSSEMKAIFGDSRGICAEHGRDLKLNKQGNVLGISRLYAAALEHVIELIEAAPDDPAPAGLDRLLRRSPPPALAEALEPVRPCMICERLDEYEAEYILMFDQFLGDARFQETFAASAGLCLPHFRAALRAVRAPADRELLMREQVRIWRTLQTQVASFSDKQNIEHFHEIDPAEGDSWSRAIDALAGAHGLFGPHRDG